MSKLLAILWWVGLLALGAWRYPDSGPAAFCFMLGAAAAVPMAYLWGREGGEASHE